MVLMDYIKKQRKDFTPFYLQNGDITWGVFPHHRRSYFGSKDDMKKIPRLWKEKEISFFRTPQGDIIVKLYLKD